MKRECKCGWKGNEDKCTLVITGTGTLSNPTDYKFKCPKCKKNTKQVKDEFIKTTNIKR